MRLYLTHYGFAENPAAHITEFRERLRGWASRAGKLLASSPDQASAMKEFVETTHAEMLSVLPKEDVDHFASLAAVDLSFLGLARYHQKKAENRN